MRGRFFVVVSVALFRLVWWMARRSARFVTALMLMALLSGGAAGIGPVGSPDTAGPLATTDLSAAPDLSSVPCLEPPIPAADRAGLATGEFRPAADDGGAAAEATTYTVASTQTAVEPRLAVADDDGDHPAPGAEPPALGDRPAPGELSGIGPRTWPTGDAYPRTSGSRAPPRR